MGASTLDSWGEPAVKPPNWSDAPGAAVPTDGEASRPDLVDGLNEIFSSAEVFGDAGDDLAHVRNILRDRCSRIDDEPSAQLAFLCDRYVHRFHKRMTILQKRGGERRESLLAEHHWAARLKAFLNRPFASRASLLYYFIISLLVIASCISLVIQTIPAYNPLLFPGLQSKWNAAELTFAALLFIDWALRLVAVVFEPQSGRNTRLRRVLTFLRQPSTILDFCASFVPAMLTFAGDANSVFQIFTLLRVFRIFFSLRHFDAFEDLEDTIKSSLPSLTGPLIALMVVLVGISSLVYTMEAGSYNEDTHAFMVRRTDCELTAAYDLGKRRCFRVESKFLSVVHTMWYTLITFLTVGYGDLVPLTASGRGLGAVSIVVGVLFMAMPIAIVGTNFTFTVDRLRTERHCVARMMEEATELQTMRAEVDAAIKAKTEKTALPSIALLRFLRLNLRQTHIDLGQASRQLTYFVDVYLARVVDALLSPRHSEFTEALAQRALQRRRPFASRLELALPPLLAKLPEAPVVRHSLNLPLTMSIGSAAKAQLALSSSALNGWVEAEQARQKASSAPRFFVAGSPTAAAAASHSRSMAVASPASYVALPFIAPLHAFVTLIGYGGAVDTLTLAAVEPFGFTLLDANLRECANLGAAQRSGYLLFGKPPPHLTQAELKDLFHVRLQYGATFRVFDRSTAAPVGK